MTDWDKLAVSTPLNREAGLVTSRSAGMVPDGPVMPAALKRWHTAPRTKPLLPGHPDLSGRVVGALVVIGYLGKPNPKQCGKWLVRCRCGYFEARTARALTNPANVGDACVECRYVENLKTSDRKRSARAVRYER